MTRYGLGVLALGNSWEVDLVAGISTAVAAFALSESAAAPALARVVQLWKGSQGPEGTAPPAVLPSAVRAAALSAPTTVVLLLITTVFMVAAGSY